MKPEVLQHSGLIGRLYNAGKHLAEHKGLANKDVKALYKAYIQSIDAAKHGNHITLPEHLHKLVGYKPP